jgi:hypothetical protein
LLKLRDASKAAAEKATAHKGDKGLRRAHILARRDLVNFWYGFRTHQLKQARDRAARLSKERVRLGQQLRQLAAQAMK